MWGAPMTHHCLSLLSYTPQSLCALFLTQNRAGHRILTSLPFHSFLVINMSHWSIWLVASILISSSTQVEKFLQRVYCIGWVKSANTPGGFCDLMTKKHDIKKYLRGKDPSWWFLWSRSFWYVSKIGSLLRWICVISIEIDMYPYVYYMIYAGTRTGSMMCVYIAKIG